MIPVCQPYLNGNELKYVDDAVRTGWISSSSKYVKAFEEAFAEYCGVKYAVGVCNGTTAERPKNPACPVKLGDHFTGVNPVNPV